MKLRFLPWVLLAWAGLALVGFAQAPPEPAELDAAPPIVRPKFTPKLNLSGQLGKGNFGGLLGGDDAKYSAQLEVVRDSREGVLQVTVEIPPEHHTYSMTVSQELKGQPTKLTLPKGGPLQLLGPFEPDTEPKRHFAKDFGNVEEHRGTVTWSARVSLADGTDPETANLAIQVNSQVCKDADENGKGGNCTPIRTSIPIRFVRYIDAPAATPSLTLESSHVTWTGRLEPAVVAPGGGTRLILRAEPETGWHIYPYAPKAPEGLSSDRPTLIVLSKTNGWYWSEPVPANNPPLKPGVGGMSYYEGPVEWVITLKAPQAAGESEGLDGKQEQLLRGVIGFQLCANGCALPSAVTFSVPVRIGEATRADAVAPVGFEELKLSEKDKAEKLGPYDKAAAIATNAPPPSLATRINWLTLWPQLGFAVLGGLLLNLMPCVLPVIGLKVLSFARQAGQSHARILALNVAYVAGLMLVFLLLATAAAFLNWGWGQQFTSLWFRVTMVCLVFAMALSFLGIWQLPVPGFATSEKAGKLQNQHGYGGAFFKGMFTTVLATPCSGPFLGAVFGYTLTQPPVVTYLIFAAVGLGMGSPYLLVGIAPRLVKFLPKPGEWMETFENFLGFVLLATVVYLMAITGQKYFIPTFALLVGIWFACWLIGRVPEYAGRGKVIATWGVASLLVAAVSWGSFTYLGPVHELYKWKPYNEQTLAELQKEGKTVMLDFTADWCATCQLNFRWAINTSRVKSVLDANGVVAVKADWSDYSEDIKQKLREYESNSIPLLVIISPDQPDEPIILRDAVIESQVVAALEKAGPSRKDANIKLERSTAMRAGGERAE